MSSNSKDKLPPLPPPEEIELQFENLLKYQGITPNEKRYKLMNNKPLEEKWKLVKIMQNSKKETGKFHTPNDTPQTIVNRLKDEPTLGSITELINILKGVKSDDDWILKFLDLQGLECLFQIILDQQVRERYVALNQLLFNGTNDVYRDDALCNEEECRDALQTECVKALRILTETNPGLSAFLQNKDKSAITMAKILESRNIRTKTQAFFLLTKICRFEQGFWIAIDVMNKYKLNRNESVRFQTTVSHLVSKKGEEVNDYIILFKTSVIVFINTLINSPKYVSVKKQLIMEFVNLKMKEISEELKALDLDDTLTMQLSFFDEQVQDFEDEEEEEHESYENPAEILKHIKFQLGGSKAFESFVEILQYLSIVSIKSNEEEKSKNMKNILQLIKQIVEFEQDGEVSAKELQLTMVVEAQQTKITQLEAILLKLADMKSGDEKDVDLLNSITNLRDTNQSSLKSMDPLELKDVFLKDGAKDFLTRVKPKKHRAKKQDFVQFTKNSEFDILSYFK